MSNIIEIYDFFKEVIDRNGGLDRFTHVFRKKHRVLVMGGTGVGKTQLLKSFDDMFAETLHHEQRTQYPTSQRIDIEGNLFEFIDTPGQELHSTRRRRAIAESMKAGIDGVINLACYGYHEYGLNAERVFEKDGNVRDIYLRSHRRVEIDLLSEWLPLLNEQWVYTVVSKADVWWDSRETIVDYYTRGTYHEAVRSINPDVEEMITPYSAVSSMFYSRLPTSGRFNDEQRKIYRQKLIEGLIQAVLRVGG